MIIEAQTRIPRSGTIGTNGVLKCRTDLEFDRWENQIFESDDINTSWDCIASKNNPMHEGVYLYRLEMRSKTNKDIVKIVAITFLK